MFIVLGVKKEVTVKQYRKDSFNKQYWEYGNNAVGEIYISPFILYFKN